MLRDGVEGVAPASNWGSKCGAWELLRTVAVAYDEACGSSNALSWELRALSWLLWYSVARVWVIYGIDVRPEASQGTKHDVALRSCHSTSSRAQSSLGSVHEVTARSFAGADRCSWEAQAADRLSTGDGERSTVAVDVAKWGRSDGG